MRNQQRRHPLAQQQPASRRHFLRTSAAATAALAAGASASAQERGAAGAPRTDLPAFRDLFNGKDLAGWVVTPAGAEKTWSVRDGVIVCSGHPNGILRTDRHYENFVLQMDWMHMEPGGNSGSTCGPMPSSTLAACRKASRSRS